MSIPTIRVPVTVLLDLARNYMEVPQELLNKQTYLEAIFLERRAYRSLKEYRKKLREKGEGG